MYAKSFYIIIVLFSLQQEQRSVPANNPLSEGKLIYTKGESLANRNIQAQYLNQKVSARTIACATCHGIHGGGGTDASGVIVPPITRTSILEKIKKTGNQIVPDDRYISRMLKRAIATGIGLDGNTLHVLMPRYELTLTEMNSLLDYLKTLDSAHSN